MKTKLASHLDAIIENVCGEGCQQVRQFINRLRQGHVDDKVKSLKPQERDLVLEELESIMAVYKHQ